MTAMVAVYEQEHYRIRDDTTTPDGGTPNWISDEDQATRTSIGTGGTFRIRFTIANTGNANTTPSFSVYYSYEGGTYTEVTATSTHVQVADASVAADGLAIATGNFVLTAGTGTARAGEYDEDGALTGNVLNAGDYSEVEYGLTIINTAVNDLDTLDFRVYQDDTAFDVYDTTALVIVDKPAVSTPFGAIYNHRRRQAIKCF